jgi:cobalt-zinc-cadmium efflux system outer membrane protein
MRAYFRAVVPGLIGNILVGCSSVPSGPELVLPRPRSATPTPAVVQAAYLTRAAKDDEKSPTPKQLGQEPIAADPAPTQDVSLADLVKLTLERNPRLAQVAWAINTARGRAVQAGLYPNPVVNITGNEIADRTGPGGIWTTPMVYQQIVTANKLGLSKAAALRQVDQATLNLITERYRVLTEVRQAFFEVATLERRREILTRLVKLAEQSVQTTQKLLKAKEAARLDVVQLEVDRERYRAELEATERSLPAAYRRLAASVGVSDLPVFHVSGDLETPLPDYDLERVRAYVLGIHPELRSARIGVDRAQILVRRAEVEPIPNLTINTGYTRQNQNKSSDWDIGFGFPVPLWNRNQGNILAAKAQLGEAINNIGRVRNDLVNRLATSFGTYAAARKRAERYKSDIIPRAQETYQLALKAYQGGQFEYLRVLQAQRAVAEANLEYLRSLGEMWRSASAVAGLMLEDQWPLPPAPAPERKQP